METKNIDLFFVLWPQQQNKRPGKARTFQHVAGSSGLVIMGGDSCSDGCGFKSQHCILDGHFSRAFVVKIVMFV